MAIRKREGRASPYQVYWNNPFTGKRECANFATEEEAKKHNSLVKHRLKFERELFKPQEEEKEEEKQNELTLEQVYLLYLREKQFNKEGLKWQIGAMKLPLKRFGNKSIVDFCYDDFSSILEEMKRCHVKMVTIKNRLSVLRTVIRWAAAHDYCQTMRLPKLPIAHYEKLVPPTNEEIDNMLAVAPPHLQRVVIIGCQCGVRVGPSELFKLTWDNVDFTSRTLTVYGAKKNPTAPWREVPIRECLLDIFHMWKREDMQKCIPWIIHYQGKPLRSIKNSWRVMLKNSGITRRIRPYDLRHAFATELIAGGADIGTVARLMGHSSPNMIFGHYQYVMDKQKRAAIEALPNISYVPKNMCPNKESGHPLEITA